MSYSKIIKFDYVGGTQTQKFNICGTNLPWRYKCDTEWITIETGATSIIITVPTTYDFHDRSGVISLFDRFDNKLEILVEQKGYYNLSVECSKSLVLYHSYYDTHKNFDFYVTIYGGTNQKPICKELEDNLIQVWDNSDMYNDYILRITEDINGDYTIEHSEAKEFISYCKENGIEYDNSKLIKNISITQVNTDDVIGEIDITVNGEKYKSGDECKVTVNNTDWLDITIDSTKYIHVNSYTDYSVIDDRIVDCQQMADWLECKSIKGLVKIKATEENLFNDRYTNLRLINRTNAHQYIDILVEQKCNVKN